MDGQTQLVQYVGTPLRITLAKRLLTFRQSIQKLEKDVLKQILNLVESDVRTVTGRNLKGPLKKMYFISKRLKLYAEDHF